MKTRAELLHSPAYWLATYQCDLYSQIDQFMKDKNMNKTQLAEYLGCTKGYVSQLLNGDFDHKLSKFIELSLAIGKIPEISFRDIDEFERAEKKTYKATLSLVSSYCTFSSQNECAEAV